MDTERSSVGNMLFFQVRMKSHCAGLLTKFNFSVDIPYISKNMNNAESINKNYRVQDR